MKKKELSILQDKGFVIEAMKEIVKGNPKMFFTGTTHFSDSIKYSCDKGKIWLDTDDTQKKVEICTFDNIRELYGDISLADRSKYNVSKLDLKFEPRSDIVLIDVISIMPKEKEGGIILPGKDNKNLNGEDMEKYFEEHPFQGIVICVGPGFKENDMEYKKGDHIYYNGQPGPVIFKGKPYGMLRLSNIIGKVID